MPFDAFADLFAPINRHSAIDRELARRNATSKRTVDFRLTPETPAFAAPRALFDIDSTAAAEPCYHVGPADVQRTLDGQTEFVCPDCGQPTGRTGP